MAVGVRHVDLRGRGVGELLQVRARRWVRGEGAGRGRGGRKHGDDMVEAF